MQRQQSIDFTSRQNELLSLMAGLRNVPIDGHTRGRVNGIVELLQRLLLFAKDMRDADELYVVAQVSAIAARITERRSVSERTVQRWVTDARALGVLDVDYRSQQFGGHSWNQYTLRLAAIRDLVYRQLGVTRGDTARHRVGPRGRHDVGPKYGRVTTTDNTDPVPVPESVADDFGLGEATQRASGLASYASRRVDPLPARSLATNGVFAPLEQRHIRSPGLIVLWFRSQLSAPSPVAGATEAHLLLVLGAAAYASSVPTADVRISRTAIFVSIVSRQRWQKTFRYLDAARSQLESMRGMWPLVGTSGPTEGHDVGTSCHTGAAP